VASFYVGALVLQYPLGWVSDRVDRRWLIMLVAACGAGAAVLATVSGGSFAVLVAAAFVIGGCSNPLYSLLIAYTNDFLNHEDMASASAGLLFVNGLGAIAGPLIIGWGMETAGPAGIFVLITVLMAAVSLYALYRMTQRAAPSVEDQSAYAAVMPSASLVAVEIAQDYYIEHAEEDEE
jgi:MFS family permease